MAENSPNTNKNLGASSTAAESVIKVKPDDSGVLVEKDDQIKSASVHRLRTKQTARKTCGGPGTTESIQRMQLMALKADPKN